MDIALKSKFKLTVVCASIPCNPVKVIITLCELNVGDVVPTSYSQSTPIQQTWSIGVRLQGCMNPSVLLTMGGQYYISINWRGLTITVGVGKRSCCFVKKPNNHRSICQMLYPGEVHTCANIVHYHHHKDKCHVN